MEDTGDGCRVETISFDPVTAGKKEIIVRPYDMSMTVIASVTVLDAQLKAVIDSAKATGKPTIWYIKDDGSIECVGGKYDPVKQCFVFTTTHLSQYVLVSDSTAKNSFTDVAEGAHYYDAVLWAVKKGITAGTGATTFSPSFPATEGRWSPSYTVI